MSCQSLRLEGPQGLLNEVAVVCAASAFRGMSGGLLLMSVIRQLLMTDLLGYPEQCSSIISAPRGQFFSGF
ncbi:hypothetical protein CEXT_214271 [Caerostris extrusa]|uniref:Uncharacterized protein n=1 Tax=Caerostris extrusa TaxID=172846 RepID=A0AAV4N614_CAEEX|nr:hypothetical protein CEXT_214271 [Caerostris extrusa]